MRAERQEHNVSLSALCSIGFQNKDHMIKHRSEAAEIPKNKDFLMKTCFLFDFDCFFSMKTL